MTADWTCEHGAVGGDGCDEYGCGPGGAAENDVKLTDAEREALYPIVRKSVSAYMTVERVLRERMAEAWREGRDDRHTIECRFDGAPDDCLCPNPYRAGGGR